MKTGERDQTAALNNAAWCAAVWRSHGLPVEQAHGLWFCPAPTPQYYPNVVTVDRGADLIAQTAFIADLALAAPEGGFSVKDSFACLDLEAAGLSPLFSARWLWRRDRPAAQAPQMLDWRGIEDETSLALWERAWRGDDPDTGRIFQLDMLADPCANLFGGFDPAGEIRAGASAYDAAGVTGVGNIFGSWPQAAQAIAALSPPQPIVGYERGRDLIAAEKAGFEPLGALRVWTRAEPA